MIKTILSGCFSLLALACFAQNTLVETDQQYNIRMETERSLNHLVKANGELFSLAASLPEAGPDNLRLPLAKQFEIALALADEILILSRTEGRTKLLQANLEMGKTEYALDNLQGTWSLIELSLALATNNDYLKTYESEKEEIKELLNVLVTYSEDIPPFDGFTQWEAHMLILNLKMKTLAFANALLTEEISHRNLVHVD